MSHPTETKAPDREQSPWTRPWFIASAAVVVLLIALAVVYVALPAPGAGQSSAPSPAATTTSTAQAGQESACGLPAGDQRYPSVGLLTKWELVGKFAVPSDPKGIGPGKVEGTVRTCYQHSPTGALYSAANYVGTGLLPGGQTIILQSLTAQSPLRDQSLATPPTQAPVDPSLSTQIAGFKVVTYTGQAARIALGLKVIKDNKVGYGSMTFGLRWENGDWKSVLEEYSYSSGLTDLSDFVQWTGA
ncbi:hypothetical protein AB6813_11960 [bacterium RCC_150]